MRVKVLAKQLLIFQREIFSIFYAIFGHNLVTHSYTVQPLETLRNHDLSEYARCELENF
jgi:hypothetical protein